MRTMKTKIDKKRNVIEMNSIIELSFKNKAEKMLEHFT